MEGNFIKGFLYKEIYRNEINGYMVGLFKVKDNNIDYDDDMIHITGILPRLSEKKNIFYMVKLFIIISMENNLMLILLKLIFLLKKKNWLSFYQVIYFQLEKRLLKRLLILFMRILLIKYLKTKIAFN